LPWENLVQAIAYGAKSIAVEDNFDDAFNMVKEILQKHPIALVNSINPNRIEGQKTAAFEVCQQLEEIPDYLCLPAGNAGVLQLIGRGSGNSRQQEK